MNKVIVGFVVLLWSSLSFAGFPSITSPSTNSTGAVVLTGNFPDSSYFFHDIWRRKSNGSWERATTAYQDRPVTDTVPSGTYYYRSRWANPFNGNVQYSSWSSSIKVTVSISSPPASAPSLSLPSTDNDGSFLVSWRAVGGATHYNLQSSINGASFRHVYGGSDLSRTVSAPSGTHEYRIEACNNFGCSAYSPSRTITVTLPAGVVPAAPASISVVPHAPVVYWTSSALAEFYEVERSTNPNNFIYAPFSTTSSEHIFLGGSPYVNHRFRVRACNSNGCSNWKATN